MSHLLNIDLNIEETELKKLSEFTSIISDILTNREFKKLAYFSHHIYTSRYQHSINVAYYTYKMAKALKLDYVSATRGAMLHDFFLYYWQDDKLTIKEHSDLHPKITLENAKKYFEVNEIMEDCILNHMWPMTSTMPKTMEGKLVQTADKYSASVEVSKESLKMVKVKTFGLLAFITK